MASTRALALAAVVLLAPPAAHAQSAANGAAVYQDRCVSCHLLSGSGQGPNLAGVVGRKAGALAGYGGYSDAMKGSGLVWTAANLDKFLQGPTHLVPGTAMRAIVSNPLERADLIAYLATLKR